jgi:hypothetical protein
MTMTREDTMAPSPNLVAQVNRLERTKVTWQMTAEELAKVYAVHVGSYGAAGGWIYSARHRPLAHGWTAYARRLRTCGIIVPGKGINWGKA